VTRADALERILAMARRRGFEDGRTGKPSLVERVASPRELVVGLATAAGGGLLKVGEPDTWAAQITTAYARAYRSGVAERPTVARTQLPISEASQ
jgi:hypothetical protein